jgi:histidine triad (HIT) family protein
MMSQCIFCRIVADEVPSVRLYEDEEVLSFLDIAPIVKGHALVIPKRHYDPLTTVPPPSLHRLIEVVQRMVRAQLEGLKADGVNVHQCNGAAAGQVVPHVHFHVIPRFHDDGHHWNWRGGRYENDAEMRTMADRIRHAICR